MTKPIIIVGAGGHARVVLEALLRSGRIVQGFTDCNKKLWNTDIDSIPVIGGDERIYDFDPDKVELAIGMGAVARYGDNGLGLRMKVFNRFRNDGFSFAKVIGRGAVIATDARIGQATQIMAGAIVQPGCVIGDNVIVNTKTQIDHECEIGDHCHLAPGSVLCGNVMVGAESYIGAGAVIIQGIDIGKRSLVAAGAIVSRNVAPKTVYDRGLGRRDTG